MDLASPVDEQTQFRIQAQLGARLLMCQLERQTHTHVSYKKHVVNMLVKNSVFDLRTLLPIHPIGELLANKFNH